MKTQKNELIQFPLPKGWKLKIIKDKGPVIYTTDNQILGLDYFDKTIPTRKQPLTKAIGFKGNSLSILDITAGWAKDAFLISKLGCLVTAIEKNPFIFYFVQEALNQKKLNLSCLNLILGDSLNHLRQLTASHQPDVIYMDPMFEGKKKSLSNKYLSVLKTLSGETSHKQVLFELAIKKAKRRVVVKRHHLEHPFQTAHRLCSYKGRSICYDVFQPKSSRYK